MGGCYFDFLGETLSGRIYPNASTAGYNEGIAEVNFAPLVLDLRGMVFTRRVGPEGTQEEAVANQERR